MLFSLAFLQLFTLHNAVAQRHDMNLMSFMTLPEVRALKWEVNYHHRSRVAPGYWFFTPYSQIEPEQPTQKYQKYQIGPYIYDEDGMLIWAGSPMWDNQNVFDFRAINKIDDQPHLSMIVGSEVDGSSKGKGVIVDTHYEIEQQVEVLDDLHDFNIYEFNVLPGGKSALACTYRSRPVNMEDFGRPTEESWVISGGFVELDVATNEVLMQWESFDHIPLHESNLFHVWDTPMGPPGWDYAYINAVDKNEAGDYIISLRFTNTIYGISGKDGHILWRLGGLESDFDMDFIFSKQHDVRFVSSNSTHHIISIMNNASDERGNDENISSALYIEVDTVAMMARVIKRVNRPDSSLTRVYGSVQTLPNENVFVGWSERGYQSEHAPNGDILMTARFASTRYSTYRAYKGEFVGRPNQPPDVMASVYGTTDEDITTIIYVSWNGATDVIEWNFYAQAYDVGTPVFIGHADKTDFETMYIVDGYMDRVAAEAIDVNGKVIGTSRIQRSDIPSNWKAVGWLGESDPTPGDPSMIASINKGTDTTANSHDSMDSMAEIMGNNDSDKSSYANAKEVTNAIYKAHKLIRDMGGLLIFILAAYIVGGVLYGTYRMRQKSKLRSYQHVPLEEGLPLDDIHLRS
ncbi:uncharacterized protein N7498_006104 [Penicillium cinerascens]|uniref:ASST-domain-containing protein n=1 Tax=Penicillium cinerascens TaxID=70096 RepID=A0A9W9SX52_9EURO|nr:uncharacterized protein N7498_006104 [Penicillium cinerascens]KAJ5201441.1 hypothetical protein N7498_006104 [Penicillium cinerascens]